MRWMLKNSHNKVDGSWTLCVVGFVVTSLCIVVSMLKSLQIGLIGIELSAPDTTLVLGYLATSTGNYLMRSNAKLKADSENV